MKEENERLTDDVIGVGLPKKEDSVNFEEPEGPKDPLRDFLQKLAGVVFRAKMLKAAELIEEGKFVTATATVFEIASVLLCSIAVGLPEESRLSLTRDALDGVYEDVKQRLEDFR